MKGIFFDTETPDYNYMNLFLVEGKDDAIFLELIFSKMNLSQSEVRIIVCGGKSEIGKHLRQISKSPSYRHKINSLAIFRDADDDFAAALLEVHKDLRRVEMPLPGIAQVALSAGKRFGVYLFPKPFENGDLELLALQIASMSPVLDSSVAFVEGLASNFSHQDKISKRKVQVLLATNSKEIRPTVGWAFKDDTISTSLDSVPQLVDFIRLILNAA